MGTATCIQWLCQVEEPVVCAFPGSWIVCLRDKRRDAALLLAVRRLPVSKSGFDFEDKL